VQVFGRPCFAKPARKRGAYTGPKRDTALDELGNGTVELVRRSDTAKGIWSCCHVVGSSSGAAPD